MGYYQIVTSETDMKEEEIIQAYHGLTQIEDQFREMKGTLATRPIYVSTREHIQAHLLICMMALTMLRLIQKKFWQISRMTKMPIRGVMACPAGGFKRPCKSGR